MSESLPFEVEVWFDLVCPFCYIGKRRLERALAALGRPVRRVYRSFQLSPDAPRQTDLDLNVLLGQRYGLSRSQATEANAQVAELGRQYGLHFDFAAARWANSLDAHRLLKLAALFGRQDALLELLYSAFFAQGLPIGEPATLKTLAACAQIPAEEVEHLLASERFRDELAADRVMALRLGVQSVPTYRIRDRMMRSEDITPEALVRLANT